MKLEKIPEFGKVPDDSYSCPECNERTLWTHDLRCSICDNFSVVYCPRCVSHFRVRYD